MQYSQIRNDLKTGDLVLFSGKGMISNVIKLMTRSNWSHVGMVVRIEDWDAVMLWEATNTKRGKDFYSGKPKKGVQLVNLSDRVATALENGYEVAVRQLHDFELTAEHRKSLAKLREAFKHKEYEESIVELFKSAYDGFAGSNEEDNSSLFCSELVAEAYQTMGLIAQDKASNEFVPKDFSSEKDLGLLKGSLSDETLLVSA